MNENKLDTKYDLYDKAYNNVLEAYNNNSSQDVKPLIKKLIVYGVKMVNSKSKHEAITEEQAEYDFNFVELIKTCMASLTPNEFVNIFPIEKTFDGHKYETKDYFYTRDYIAGLDQVKPIGEEILNLLWEYTNREVRMFNVRSLGYISNLRQFQGEPSLMEEWADTIGIKTYTKLTDDKGKEFMFDKETGKTTKIKKSKPKPRYLKVIK
jgi:hypothetical protein